MSNLKNQMPIIDDVGSVPLGPDANEEMFHKLYWDAYDAFVKGIDVTQNRSVQRYVIKQIEDACKLKIESGIEIVNYPQLMEMGIQFLKPINDYELEPYVIDPSKARIMELELLREFAKSFYEKNGKPLLVKSCVTGPLELYPQKMGFSIYKDVAINLAKSINSFLKNSIFHEKYIETKVVSIDEPSIGYVTFNQVTNDDISDILQESAKNLDADVQIHLHSLNAYQMVLSVKEINVLTCEYASNQKNVIPKADLEQYDKFMRVGITRTRLSAMISEEIEKGADPRLFQDKNNLFNIIDSLDRIKARYNEAINRYGERLRYVGPDCGLKSWNYQDLAFTLVKKTVQAVNEIRKIK